MENIKNIEIRTKVIFTDGSEIEGYPVNFVDVIRDIENELKTKIDMDKHFDYIEYALNELYKFIENIDNLTIFTLKTSPISTIFIKADEIRAIEVTDKEIIINLIKEYLSNRKRTEK